jgi:hypothetical protein
MDIFDLFINLIKMILRNSFLSKFRKIKDDSIFQEMTIEEAEDSLQINCDDLDNLENPSYFIKRWKEFKSNIQDGDKIYYFRSPSWTWERLCGRSGYALYRDGKQIDALTTMIN